MEYSLFATGRLEGLYTTPDPEDFVTAQRSVLDFSLEGIPGDRHAGHTRPSGGREKKQYQPGTKIHNNRQWSAVSVEELAEAAKKMGLDALKPEWLGANLLVSGIAGFTALPPLALLRIGDPKNGVVLTAYGENKPCLHPHKALEKSLGQTVKVPFTKAANGLRGLVGWVEKPGKAHVADTLEVWIPA